MRDVITNLNNTKGTAETLDNLMDATNMSMHNMSIISLKPYDQMSVDVQSFHQSQAYNLH